MDEKRVLLSFALVFIAGLAYSQVADIRLPQDQGPNEIDVSKYPQDMKRAYQVVKEECSSCHAMARVTNTTMPAGYWARYLGTIIKEEHLTLSDEKARLIADFLIYDQRERKDKLKSGLYPPLTEEEIETLRKKAGTAGTASGTAKG